MHIFDHVVIILINYVKVIYQLVSEVFSFHKKSNSNICLTIILQQKNYIIFQKLN